MSNNHGSAAFRTMFGGCFGIFFAIICICGGGCFLFTMAQNGGYHPGVGFERIQEIENKSKSSK